MSHSLFAVVCATALSGCAAAPCRSSATAQRAFVVAISAAVADCARRGAPPVCPEADRLAATCF